MIERLRPNFESVLKYCSSLFCFHTFVVVVVVVDDDDDDDVFICCCIVLR